MNPLVYIILSCAVILQAKSQSNVLTENKPDLYYAEEKCVEELKLVRAEMMNVVINPHSPEDSKDDGKFFVCTWTKRGIMKKDGTISEEKLKAFLEQIAPDSNALTSVIIDKTVEQCKQVKGSTPGQVGIKLKNCIVEVLLAHRV